jgi:hypothetical protein
MAIFKRLIQNPSSPDKDIKAAGAARYKQSTFARLTDTNALSRDINDAIAYTLPLTAAATGTQTVTTKKGEGEEADDPVESVDQMEKGKHKKSKTSVTKIGAENLKVFTQVRMI